MIRSTVLILRSNLVYLPIIRLRYVTLRCVKLCYIALQSKQISKQTINLQIVQYSTAQVQYITSLLIVVQSSPSSVQFSSVRHLLAHTKMGGNRIGMHAYIEGMIANKAGRPHDHVSLAMSYYLFIHSSSQAKPYSLTYLLAHSLTNPFVMLYYIMFSVLFCSFALPVRIVLQDVMCGRGGQSNNHPGNEW